MKQINGKIKFVFVIIAIIIILGITIAITKGFEKSIKYSEHIRLEITLNDLDKEKVEEVIKEIYAKEATIQTIGDFEDKIGIETKNLEEEKQTNLQEKLKELNNGEEVTINQVNVGKVELKDVIKPYLLPMGIIAIIFAIYMGIKYREEGIVKNIIMPIIILGIVEAIYFSIVCICRIPIEDSFMLIATLIEILAMMTISIVINNKITKADNKQEK